MILREQLELVVQRKKIDEVHKWFRDHFIDSSKDQYVTRCPFLIIQGPPGCGKTSTLRYVANQIGIPILEFCETTETIYINHDLNESSNFREAEDRSHDRWRAAKFERFVEQKLRFVPLPEPLPIAPSADSEFDIESDEELPASIRPRLKSIPVEQKPSGIIIHVEASLTFAKSQKILMSTMANIIKTFKQLARFGPRRAAIVFENFDCGREVVSLPTKFKQAIGLEAIKFNPIIKANMKKFIEFKLRNYQNIVLDKNTAELLVNDCDGDLSACLNSLEMMSSKMRNHSNISLGMYNDILTPLNNCQVSKRQRFNPERFQLNASLMRDVTRSCGFFHLLGKILYQKRLYPDGALNKNRKYRSIDRPYVPENSTEYLSAGLYIDPKILLTWLHQHYPKFCGPTNIDKASSFLGHLSDTDTISINSMQSSQFYEMHHIIKQQQMNLALEFTTFSLYEDQSALVKSSHKKVHTNQGTFIVKSSVESSLSSINGELYSFSRPDCLSMSKVIEDRQTILKYLSDKILKDDLSCTDPTKILVDYLPYLSIMSDAWSERSNYPQSNGNALLNKNNEASKLIKMLENLEITSPNTDFDVQHEMLSELIETVEEESNIKTKGRQHYAGRQSGDRVMEQSTI